VLVSDWLDPLDKIEAVAAPELTDVRQIRFV